MQIPPKVPFTEPMSFIGVINRNVGERVTYKNSLLVTRLMSPKPTSAQVAAQESWERGVHCSV